MALLSLYLTLSLTPNSSVHFDSHTLITKIATYSLTSQVITPYVTNHTHGTSLVVQRLRRHVSNVGSPGSIPVQGTRSPMPHLKDSACCS